MPPKFRIKYSGTNVDSNDDEPLEYDKHFTKKTTVS